MLRELAQAYIPQAEWLLNDQGLGPYSIHAIATVTEFFHVTCGPESALYGKPVPLSNQDEPLINEIMRRRPLTLLPGETGKLVLAHGRRQDQIRNFTSLPITSQRRRAAVALPLLNTLALDLLERDPTLGGHEELARHFDPKQAQGRAQRAYQDLEHYHRSLTRVHLLDQGAPYVAYQALFSCARQNGPWRLVRSHTRLLPAKGKADPVTICPYTDERGTDYERASQQAAHANQ
jgi:hypothetical protein